ncbi:Di-copper centre-containing protein [Pleomassaria siparia CBS 279.74]|uniref:tyrosinase n=1 Tax=Pleomassaria siparia CBS 279.74 TaxID=1314801 RepID=A0A6G1JZ99_9PLEO|nr:Di-copper centre-containing protein [Pleomassaria siparia CBS 279.74]
MAAHSKPRSMVTMLFALFLFLQATTAISHASGHKHPAHRSQEGHVEESRNILEGRANNIAIVGVVGSNTVLSPRLEIRDLQKNADQWNLYLLGMERFKAKDKTDSLSYYQVAGIHGRPYVTWNNFPTPLLNVAGFCPHACVLFGTWHRPYLAIYEQALYQSVLEVIDTFPAAQQSRWKEAARTLRIPYWDWAKAPPSGQTNVPAAIRDQTVTVTKPSGQVTIANPLYSYTWGTSLPAEMGGGPYGNSPTTLRRPVSNPTRSNNNEMNTKMNALRISLRDRVYGLFMSGASWGAASTSAIGVRLSSTNSVDSFESVHDVIHNTAGGESGGHMYYLDYSSFDPIFWLHHTNIDRLLAMYQVTTPNTYMANGNIPRNMAQWNKGEPKNSNTPLKPFTKDSAGNYFTSNDVKNTAVFGYTYPETAGSPTANSIKAAVNSLYGPSSSSKKRSTPTGQYEGRPFKEGDYNTVLSIVANKMAIAGSYTVHCFIGDVNHGNSTSTATATVAAPASTGTSSAYTNSTGDSTGDYTESPNYVGSYGIFGGSQKGDEVMTEGCIPLTTALQGKEATGELKSLKPDDVESYLAKNLYYKVIGPGGVEINVSNMTDFHVYAKSCKITPPASPDDLPTLGDYVKIPAATHGKPGGAPFVYVPKPVDIYQPTPPTNEEPSTTLGTSYPTGTMVFPGPEQEQGYCVSQQTIEYVDESGKFLYSEKS